MAQPPDNPGMDDHQVHVPDSFLNLFRPEGRAVRRLSEPWHHVLARYELCEDMAQALCPQALALRGDLGVTSGDVVRRMVQGLDHPSVGLAPEELDWVGSRLWELMETAG